MKQRLTSKQASALDCIQTFIQQNGYSPSIRELAEALGYNSSSTVHALLDKLIEKGYISKEPTGPRTIRVLKEENASPTDEPELQSPQFVRMKAALINILDVSTDDFALHQARYGLGIDK
jgi:SOS-response transcriptional repressors (RecA-mediated autopeptidases)